MHNLDSEPSWEAPLRPKDLADLLLAGGDMLPRQRARDQQADRAGMTLKQDVLLRLSALDPDPEQLDATLVHIINAIGEPTGPTRGICHSVRYDWDAACQSPAFTRWLIAEALQASSGEPPRKRRKHHAQ
jgi:hypothetical protein